MKQRVISLLLVLCLMVSMLTGCGIKSTTDANGDATTKIFTDSAGRQVTVPADITKIACSGSLAQIVIFALAPEMMVGLASEWDKTAEQFIPTDYYNLPVLGQFYGKGNLNLEEVAKVAPQVIIDVGESKDTIVEDMDGIAEQVGIPTVHIEATTATMGDAYRLLGELLGKQEEANELAAYCDQVYQNTQDIIRKIGEDKKGKVVYCTGEDGLNVLAKGSFHAEILDMLTDNQAAVDEISNMGTGNPVDMEQLLLWDPDVILFAPDSIYSSVADDKDWQQLKAIQNGTYYEVPFGPYNWMGNPPSINRYIGMIWLSELLYPETANYNMQDETAKYYKLFYHTEITEEQYQALVANSIEKQQGK
ncbi:MAG: iron complex transport system substrate-binding protein [Clostridiales bacterium]|nr:iron complex transport system substrate-binding protein [Clostridiales bacterium]